MNPDIFVLINSVDIERGGLTKATLKQAATFIELGYKTHLLTFNFNPKYPHIINELQKMNRLHKDLIIHNMYNDLSHIDTLKPKFSKPKAVNINKVLKHKIFDERKGHNAYRIYKNGIYSEYIAIDSKLKHIDFIDYFNENRHRTKRVSYDLQGNICRKTFMDLNSNKPRQIIYYNNKGNAYLTQWNNPKTNEPIRMLQFNKDRSIKEVYAKNIESHKTDWLNNIINKNTKQQAIVISDTRSTDHVLLDLQNKKAKKVWRLHSGFLGSPYTADANIASSVQTGINNLDKFDAVVILTDEQKSDMIKHFGDTHNLNVIPHYHNTAVSSPSKDNSEINHDQAIVVSRLSSLKRIDDIIMAFKQVNEVLPNVHLDIYGKGNEYDKLSNLITELKLSSRVKLHGYVKDPDEVYKKGLFSILASKQEGFALSILESMTNKTPVISYDVKYGPNDMIINNETGILVENGNIDELAKEMIHLFKNPNYAITLGDNGQKFVNTTFSENEYREKWNALFEKLSTQNK